MLAAISTTILSRRSCALTGSAITSRSRRNSTRGPPSAARMGVIPRALRPAPGLAACPACLAAPGRHSQRGRRQIAGLGQRRDELGWIAALAIELAPVFAREPGSRQDFRRLLSSLNPVCRRHYGIME